MKELKRLKILTLIEMGQLTRADAARKLELSERQLYRIQKSYREKGEQGLVHGNRGKGSPRRISEEIREQVKKLLEDKYEDYNTLRFQEILADEYGIKLSYSTLQSIRREAGYPTPRKKRAPKHRKRRAPRPIYGMMLQANASIHPWLEERGPKLGLVALIDDATNRSDLWGHSGDLVPKKLISVFYSSSSRLRSNKSTRASITASFSFPSATMCN
jgi:transposase